MHHHQGQQQNKGKSMDHAGTACDSVPPQEPLQLHGGIKRSRTRLYGGQTPPHHVINGKPRQPCCKNTAACHSSTCQWRKSSLLMTQQHIWDAPAAAATTGVSLDTGHAGACSLLMHACCVAAGSACHHHCPACELAGVKGGGRSLGAAADSAEA
jgi:hypothetical protein